MIDNTLNIQLFFFAAAIPVALEAHKAQKLAKIILFAISAVFGIAGFWWQSLSALWPTVTQHLLILVANPVSWFVMVVSVFFVARSYWKQPVEFPANDAPGFSLSYESDLASQISAVNVRLVGLDVKAEKIRVDTAIFSTELQKLDQKVAAKDEKVLASFYAVGARERLTTLEAQIEEGAAELYDRLKAGEIYDAEQWEQWESIYEQWNGKIDEWLSTGTWYAVAVKERTLTIKDDLYRAQWSVAENQFPNAEAVRQFKKHRIIITNWRTVVPEVKRGVDSVAFAGQSEIDARHGRPPG